MSLRNSASLLAVLSLLSVSSVALADPPSEPGAGDKSPPNAPPGVVPVPSTNGPASTSPASAPIAPAASARSTDATATASTTGPLNPAPVALPPVGASPPAPLPQGALANDAQPLAGNHNGLFYLRSRDDNFRLYIAGRAQIDSFNYFGPAIQHTTLKSTLFIRRLRPELAGEFFGNWQWMLAGDWGATAFDNPRGTNEAAAGPPGTAPNEKTARFAAAQTAGIRAIATDAYLNYRASNLVNIQLGQYDAPFTMENRTSDKYLPFMERSLAVRTLGIPTNKELGLMFWGETSTRSVFYSVGLFDGDGQGRLNPDNRIDVMGRVFVHPLYSRKDALKDLQIGASFRHGRRDPDYVFYDYPSMTTQGGFQFWGPTYNSSKGVTRILPSGSQTALAGEARIPVSRFDLTSEFVWVHNGTRESVDGTESTNRERFGDMHGYSYYAELGYWLVGSRDANGLPGYENHPHLDFSKQATPPKQSVQLLVKWEQLNVKYNSASRAGAVDVQNVDGHIKVNALSLGANYWATKHIRLTANYVMNTFPDSAPTKGTPPQTSSQRAIAPGNTIGAGIDDTKRQEAHVLHELLFRAAVAF